MEMDEDTIRPSSILNAKECDGDGAIVYLVPVLALDYRDAIMTDNF